MLSIPQFGCVWFQLNDTELYSLSNIDDIAFDWIEQAINGLSTDNPFCVKGNLEPWNFLCVVSYYNCHVICEDNSNRKYESKDLYRDLSHTSMIDFCQELHDDVKNSLEAWVDWLSHGNQDPEQRNGRRTKLEKKLNQLQELIDIKREKGFGMKCY